MEESREEHPSLEALRAFARAAGIDHDDRRLAELAPTIAQQFQELARLREIDATGYEPAISFSVRD